MQNLFLSTKENRTKLCQICLPRLPIVHMYCSVPTDVNPGLCKVIYVTMEICQLTTHRYCRTVLCQLRKPVSTHSLLRGRLTILCTPTPPEPRHVAVWRSIQDY